MKRQIFFVFLLVLCLGLMAQQVDWYDMKFEKGVGTLTIKNYSFDQIWETTIKTLIMDKAKILVAEKGGKVINAQKDKSFSASNYQIQIVFIENEDSVSLIATTECQSEDRARRDGLYALASKIGDNKAREKLEKRIFEKLIANLSK